MPLKMHRSVVCYSGYYKDTVNYIVFCGEWYIGYIYENGRARRKCAFSGRYMLPASQETCAPPIRLRP